MSSIVMSPHRHFTICPLPLGDMSSVWVTSEGMNIMPMGYLPDGKYAGKGGNRLLTVFEICVIFYICFILIL